MKQKHKNQYASSSSSSSSGKRLNSETQQHVQYLVDAHIIDELREICSNMGLTVSGNKQTLALRIVQFCQMNELDVVSCSREAMLKEQQQQRQEQEAMEIIEELEEEEEEAQELMNEIEPTTTTTSTTTLVTSSAPIATSSSETSTSVVAEQSIQQSPFNALKRRSSVTRPDQKTKSSSLNSKEQAQRDDEEEEASSSSQECNDFADFKYKILSETLPIDRLYKVITACTNVASSPTYTPRIGHSAVPFQKQTKLLVFGGESTHGGAAPQLLNSVAIFDVNKATWNCVKCTGQIPERKMQHSAVMYKDRFMFVFGGLTDSNKCTNALHVLDTETWKWRRIPFDSDTATISFEVPIARCAHSMVLLADEYLAVYGGYDSKHSQFVDWTEEDSTNIKNEVYSDIWLFHIPTERWTKQQQLPSINATTMSTSSMFGNYQTQPAITTSSFISRHRQSHLNAQFRLNSQPHARCFHGAVGHQRDMYICGGMSLLWPEFYDGPFDDLWKWNMDTCEWTLVYENKTVTSSFEIGHAPKDMFHPLVTQVLTEVRYEQQADHTTLLETTAPPPLPQQRHYFYVFNGDPNFKQHFCYRFDIEKSRYMSFGDTEIEGSSSSIHKFSFTGASATALKLATASSEKQIHHRTVVVLHGAFQEVNSTFSALLAHHNNNSSTSNSNSGSGQAVGNSTSTGTTAVPSQRSGTCSTNVNTKKNQWQWSTSNTSLNRNVVLFRADHLNGSSA